MLCRQYVNCMQMTNTWLWPWGKKLIGSHCSNWLIILGVWISPGWYRILWLAWQLSVISNSGAHLPSLLPLWPQLLIALCLAHFRSAVLSSLRKRCRAMELFEFLPKMLFPRCQHGSLLCLFRSLNQMSSSYEAFPGHLSKIGKPSHLSLCITFLQISVLWYHVI